MAYGRDIDEELRNIDFEENPKEEASSIDMFAESNFEQSALKYDISASLGF